jgi:hypothetical protein
MMASMELSEVEIHGTRKPVEQNVDQANGLVEGALYVARSGRLERLERDEDDGMKRVRITGEAYERALTLGKRMRGALGGYRPDIALVVSALVMHACQDADTASQAVRTYVQAVFGRTA